MGAGGAATGIIGGGNAGMGCVFWYVNARNSDEYAYIRHKVNFSTCGCFTCWIAWFTCRRCWYTGWCSNSLGFQLFLGWIPWSFPVVLFFPTKLIIKLLPNTWILLFFPYQVLCINKLQDICTVGTRWRKIKGIAHLFPAAVFCHLFNEPI